MKNRVLKHYSVMTPEYEHWYYDEYEPPELIVDYVTVEAYTKKEARVKGVREMRKRYPHGYIADDPQANPFKGLKVEEPKCEHGYCWCDICTEDTTFEECKLCLEKWAQEDMES